MDVASKGGELVVAGEQAAPASSSTVEVADLKNPSDQGFRLERYDQLMQMRKAPQAWCDRLRVEAKKLSAHLQDGYIRLSALIYLVDTVIVEGDKKKTPLYRIWGYSSLYGWTEAELLIGKRKAQYLKQIHWILCVHLKDLDPDLRFQLIRLNFSKVRELVRVLTMDTAAQWLELAKKLPYKRLTTHVNEYRSRSIEYQKADRVQVVAPVQLLARTLGEDAGLVEGLSELAAELDVRNEVSASEEAEEVEEGAPEPLARRGPKLKVPTQKAGAIEPQELSPSKRLNFRLYEEQHEIVERALTVSSVISESDRQGHNLMLICMDFLATNGGAVPGTKSFQRYLYNLEQIFGVRLIAIDSKNEPHHLVYGDDAMGRFVRSHMASRGVDEGEEE